MKKLRNEGVNPFMLESDPKNPYGPNYEELPYETKLYYKFHRVKKYVHLTQEDQDKMINSNFQFFLGTAASMAFGCLLAYGLKKGSHQALFPKG